MNFINENVIPGEHGKTFETNAKNPEDVQKIQSSILAIEGVKDVLVDLDSFPVALTVHTSAVVNIEEIEKVVQKDGFHAIPKALFPL